MKIDRMLGMMMYLLNRDTVSARELADRFEVSVRTVQRDMEALGLAGIPVASELGIRGGYRIMESYKLNRQLFSHEEYLQLIVGLQGLFSAYASRQVEDTLEKLLSIAPVDKDAEPRLKLDLSVLRELVSRAEDILARYRLPQ